MGHGPMENPFNFGMDPDKEGDTGNFSLLYFALWDSPTLKLP